MSHYQKGANTEKGYERSSLCPYPITHGSLDTLSATAPHSPNKRAV